MPSFNDYEWRDYSCRINCEEHLEMFLGTLETRLPHLRGRATRIGAATKIIGQTLKLDLEQLYALRLASKFHDIGMLAVADSILLKNSGLTPAERKLCDLHTDIGGRLVAKAFPDFPDAVEAIWYHHERPDGKGPHGVQEAEIPVLAGIVSLIEAVESMANHRPHRRPMPLPEIKAEVCLKRGTQFLPVVVSAFLEHAEAIYETVIRKESRAPSPQKDQSDKDRQGRPNPPQEVAQLQSPTRCNADEESCVARRAGQSPSQHPCSGISESPPTARPCPAAINVQGRSKRTINELLPLISRSDIEKRIADGLELKPLGLTVQSVIKVTSDSQCCVDDVAKAIGQDQALSIRILQLANSSAYARGRQIENIKAAVSRIGTEEIRNLIMTLEVMEQSDPKLNEHLDPLFFWEHSISCGLFAVAIGKACHCDTSQDLFISGLLHDMGRVILLEHVPELYVKVLQAARESGLSLETVERKMLSTDHCDVLRIALETWRFPPGLIVPAISHHLPSAKLERLKPEAILPARCVSLGDHMTHALSLGSSGNDMIGPIDDLVEALGLPREALAGAAESVPEEARELKYSMLARAHGDSWPDRLSVLRESLSDPFRPLCLSLHPDRDACRFFCESLSKTYDAEEPDLGILSLQDAGDLDKLIPLLKEREVAVGSGPLPLVLVCHSHKIQIDEARLEGRSYAVLHSPVPVEHLVQAFELVRQGVPAEVS